MSAYSCNVFFSSVFKEETYLLLGYLQLYRISKGWGVDLTIELIEFAISYIEIDGQKGRKGLYQWM